MTRKSFALSLAALTVTASIALLGWLVWPGSHTGMERSSPEVAMLEPDPPVESPTLHTETLEIRKRDTVVASLLRHDVPSATAHEIVGTLRTAGANLRQVRPGDQLQLSHDAEGRLATLAYAPSPWVRFEVTDSGS